MFRILAAAGGLALASLAAASLATPAAAQCWGQPVYVGPYGRVVGGTPLSEVETRAYVTTGRWADGYTGPPHVYVPAPAYAGRHDRRTGYGYGYGRDDRWHDRQGADRHGYGYGHGHGGYRHDPGRRAGYRDVWGYNDDRPPTTHARSRSTRDHRHDRDCGCPDVYLYDR